jgi:cephalosporin hydroxylase
VNIRRRLLTRLFNQLYYSEGQSGGTWAQTFYRGVPVVKCPTDLWAYQEIVYETNPDLIVETGTHFGGSALYLAHLCELSDHGRVVTIDLYPQPKLPQHERITYLAGSSTSVEVSEEVVREAMGQRVMVILDSDHSTAHIREELRLYAPLVSTGCYLIVEDTNVNGHPVLPRHGAGPMEAVREFMRSDTRFVVDRRREKFLLTWNPSGYLRRLCDGDTENLTGRVEATT